MLIYGVLILIILIAIGYVILVYPKEPSQYVPSRTRSKDYWLNMAISCYADNVEILDLCKQGCFEEEEKATQGWLSRHWCFRCHWWKLVPCQALIGRLHFSSCGVVVRNLMLSFPRRHTAVLHSITEYIIPESACAMLASKGRAQFPGDAKRTCHNMHRSGRMDLAGCKTVILAAQTATRLNSSSQISFACALSSFSSMIKT